MVFFQTSNLINSLAKFRILRSVCSPSEPGLHSAKDPPGKDFGLFGSLVHHKDLEQGLARSNHSIYISFMTDVLVTSIAEKKLQRQSDYRSFICPPLWKHSGFSFCFQNSKISPQCLDVLLFVYFSCSVMNGFFNLKTLQCKEIYLIIFLTISFSPWSPIPSGITFSSLKYQISFNFHAS